MTSSEMATCSTLLTWRSLVWQPNQQKLIPYLLFFIVFLMGSFIRYSKWHFNNPNRCVLKVTTAHLQQRRFLKCVPVTKLISPFFSPSFLIKNITVGQIIVQLDYTGTENGLECLDIIIKPQLFFFPAPQKDPPIPVCLYFTHYSQRCS